MKKLRRITQATLMYLRLRLRLLRYRPQYVYVMFSEEGQFLVDPTLRLYMQQHDKAVSELLEASTNLFKSSGQLFQEMARKRSSPRSGRKA
jgi:hypothetical protein